MLKAGDTIKLRYHVMGKPTNTWNEFVVEEFRGCLGVFRSPQHRQAGEFMPLCNLYGPGPDSERKYIPNFGVYYTNEIPIWEETC